MLVNNCHYPYPHVGLRDPYPHVGLRGSHSRTMAQMKEISPAFLFQKWLVYVAVCWHENVTGKLATLSATRVSMLPLISGKLPSKLWIVLYDNNLLIATDFLRWDITIDHLVMPRKPPFTLTTRHS